MTLDHAFIIVLQMEKIFCLYRFRLEIFVDFGKFFNKNNKPESAELLLENFNTIKYQVPRNGKKAAPSKIPSTEMTLTCLKLKIFKSFECGVVQFNAQPIIFTIKIADFIVIRS